MLARVMAEVEGEKLRDSKPRVLEHCEQGVVSYRLLVASGLDVEELLGCGAKAGNLDVFEALPLRVLKLKV
jgi:hypothetical protein